jgi:hypothetical protein
MMRDRIIQGILIAAALLPVVSAWAADPPELAARKRELSQAYFVSHANGLCDVYGSLTDWQEANWPEGKPVVAQFLNDKLLPRLTSDPAAVQDMTADQKAAGFLLLCNQAGEQSLQVLQNLESVNGAESNPPPTAAETEQRQQLRASLLAATFLGQCQAASALYFDAKQENKEKLDHFVKNEIYAKDPKYRQAEIDHDEMLTGDISAELAKIKANKEKETQYWRDCDMVTAKFNEISEQLKEAP